MNQLSFNLIVGVLLRSVIAMGAGWLIAHGMLPSGTADEWISAVFLVLLAWFWSLYEKARQKTAERRKLKVALAAPAGTTEAAVEVIVKKLDAATQLRA